ncbi:hypothetical protein FH972_015612 [Carpinus fangiana]|uniref:SGNH hydrolase-type esterase domain-containing protein n=1 Tax=Carpinus fangiana TaxID=176857 RepID=A0A5N6RDL0_9ROSI|nr:hypothetical protein FH972_015612 [Carpinus fangiana]
MASLMFQCFCFLVLYATLVDRTHCCPGKQYLPQKHVALFIFGDSFFDAGNNNYINTTTASQANFSPYGENFFKYPTGRFSDGRLIPDFIAKHAKLPLIAPFLDPRNHRYIDGANFASAGAGALLETHQGFVIDLQTQLSFFKDLARLLRRELGCKKANTLLGRAVYLLHIGANDYGVFSTTNSSVLSPEEYVNMVIGNVTIVIEEIHKEGGRKFGFLSMQPLGCLPSKRETTSKTGSIGACEEEITTLAKLHNKAFSEVLEKLERQLNGFKYSITNWYTAFSERINNPSKYGFKEGRIACCGSGPYRGINSCGGKRSVERFELCGNASEYVFFDFAHPSERANQQLAELMWSGTPDITTPYNLKALFEL